MENLLEVKNLSVKFNGFELEDVSFNVEKGTIMGFIGENGAGKSTTLKLILNNINRDKGEIKVFDKDNIKDEIYLKNNVGYIPSESYFLENRTLKQHKDIFAGFYDNWDDEIFKKYLKKWNIDDKKNCGDLSTGTKTKAMLIFALAHKPELLILDEPTAGLDPAVRIEFLDEFRDFVEDGERAVLFSTHITSDLDKVADYITLIHKGKIIEVDSVDRIQEKYIMVKGDLQQLEGIEQEFIGIKVWDTSFEGLILKEKLDEKLKEVKYVVPNIENILTFYIWGDRR